MAISEQPEVPKALVSQVRKVKTALGPLDRQLTLGGVSDLTLAYETPKKAVPLYARPVDEKNKIKVKDRRSKREEFKAKLIDSKMELQSKLGQPPHK